MIIYKTGDVIKAFEEEFNVLAHGCNCFHRMGKGIALELSSKYPIIHKADKEFTLYGDINKLGTNIVIEVDEDNDKHIVNMYTQFDTTSHLKTIALSYNSLQRCFEDLYEWVKINNYKTCIPKIGAGLAGGNWNIIEGIINKIFHDIDIYVYTLN